jgi:hypothetical protein
MRTLDDSCEVIVPLSLSFAILGRGMMSKDVESVERIWGDVATFTM